MDPGPVLCLLLLLLLLRMMRLLPPGECVGEW